MIDWPPIFLTLKLATVVCILLLTIGTPIAWWLSISRWRWKFVVESVVALPLVLPPTVLGFYLLIAMGPLSPLGRFYRGMAGHGLPFTFEGLSFASVIYSLPFMVQPMAAAFAQVDRNFIHASSILGASSWRTFYRIVLPLSAGGVITGIVLSFAHTLGEFGVVLMVGGNIPGATETISIAIYDNVQSLNYAAANRMALLLMVFSFIALSLTYSLNRKVWNIWPLKPD